MYSASGIIHLWTCDFVVVVFIFVLFFSLFFGCDIVILLCNCGAFWQVFYFYDCSFDFVFSFLVPVLNRKGEVQVYFHLVVGLCKE